MANNGRCQEGGATGGSGDKNEELHRHFEAIIIDHNEQQTVADVLGDTRLF